ncbi:hypothetical protein [Ornithinicoccus halotolerans]|uniref:hypothetical protein n=1 Tax=Ornithinicoccus halotolerans TaxID=1748220 RepID=UPI001296564A|nr:hypothetical protein [Ornithinicoccus halotolerans]
MRRSRRWRHPALLGAVATVLTAVLAAQLWLAGHESVALHQAGIARDPEGRLVPLSPGRWQTALPQDHTAPYVLDPDPARPP